MLDSAQVLAARAVPFLDEFKAAVRRFPDRILYGCDYPILEPPLGLAIERLAGMGLGPELTARLLGHNAAALMAIVG